MAVWVTICNMQFVRAASARIAFIYASRVCVGFFWAILALPCYSTMGLCGPVWWIRPTWLVR
jgi:hypothetical protein